jgi:hypothetical protein
MPYYGSVSERAPLAAHCGLGKIAISPRWIKSGF